MTSAGPKVLEFNTRFGDPETQAVLPRLRTDLAELCLASREPGGLAGMRAEFTDDWAVTLVLASAGYPESSSKGDVITGLADAAALDGVEVTHAGTARDADGNVVTAGGRVHQRHGSWLRPRRGARPRVRGGGNDRFRRHANANGHRPPGDRARTRLRPRRKGEAHMETADPEGRPKTETGVAAPVPDTTPAEPMPDVEKAFEEIEVDAPRVGIIMGSKNDKPKMQGAGTGAAGRRHPLRGARHERPPRPREGPRVLP